MATPTQPRQASSGPDPVKEIENLLLKLENVKKGAIKNSDEQRKEAKSTLKSKLKEMLRKGPLTPNAAMSIYIAWKLDHPTLESERTDAEEVASVLDEIKKDLEKEQPDEPAEALRRMLAQLGQHQKELLIRIEKIEQLVSARDRSEKQ